MKIIGSEPEIAKYLLEGREITTKSTEEGMWHSTDEMGRQESLEICLSTTIPRECVGVNYNKVTEISKFNLAINFGDKKILGGASSPFSILSYLEDFEEEYIEAKLRSRFIHRKNPFLMMESSVIKEIKTEDVSSFYTDINSFYLPKNIPMNVPGISREEDSLWNELYEIQMLNSRISQIRSKEELFGVIAGLKEHIEKANIIYLDIMKNNFELTLDVKKI